MILITIVFLIPAYYLAKSKGYNAAPILITTGILSFGLPMILRCIEGLEILPVMDLTFPILALIIIKLLPEKKGAPGKKYLKISFICPECNQEVTFERRFEGKAELCPKCDEIITIPLDEFSPPPLEQSRIKPIISSGQVCFAEFGNEMFAIQFEAMLNDHGIDTEMISGIGGGTLPHLGGTQGFKVMIDINDWEAAIEIEKTANQSSKPKCGTLSEKQNTVHDAPLNVEITTKKTPKRLLIACIVLLLAGGSSLMICILQAKAIHNALSGQSTSFIAGTWFRYIAPPALLVVGAIGIIKRKMSGRRLAVAGLLLGLWPNVQEFYRGFTKAGSSSLALPITATIFSLLVLAWTWSLYSKKSRQYFHE
jgi:hypothetical protein